MGYPHPDYLLPLLTAEQFREWRLFYDLEPWGYHEEDYQRSYSRLVSVQAQGGKKSRRLKPKDFSLEEARREARKKARRRKSGYVYKQSVEEMKDILFAIAGKKTNKKGRSDK